VIPKINLIVDTSIFFAVMVDLIVTDPVGISLGSPYKTDELMGAVLLSSLRIEGRTLHPGFV